jgi:hypothetical protein
MRTAFVIALLSLSWALFAQNATPDSLIAPTPRLDAQASHQRGFDDVPSLSSEDFLRGMGLGATLSLPGVWLAYRVAKPENPKHCPNDVSVKDYRQGYFERSGTVNKHSVLIGGVMGTIIGSIIIYAYY